jgi:hypothetical protein
MAVAKARNDHTALGVDGRRYARFARYDRIAKVNDPAILNGQPGVLQDTGLALRLTFNPKNALRLNPYQQTYILNNHSYNFSLR